MARVEDLRIRAQVDGVQRAQSDMKRLSGSIGDVARSLGLVVGAAMAFRQGVRLAGEAMANYENAIQAIRQLDATLKSTGRAAEFTSQELSDMASELQALSNFGDEDILRGVTLQLLRFDAIGRDIFPRAQQLVIDLAESMGGVENAARTLGISLADPTLGLTRLRRIGVSFNSTQEAQIKNFVETGKVAEAQAVLMSALEERFGGLAVASISATTQMKNAWGDYLESVGSSLSFYDGVKRGITATLVSVAGAHDVTSKSAQLAALETQKAWGKATIHLTNGIKTYLTALGGAYSGFYTLGNAFINGFSASIQLGIDTLAAATITAMNFVSRTVINSWEKIFSVINSISTRITGKDLGIDGMFDDLRERMTIINIDLEDSIAKTRSTLIKSRDDIQAWVDNFKAIPANTKHSIDQQIKILEDGINAQREAILRGASGLDLSDFSMEDLDLGLSAKATEDYYATIMAINHSATQKIMDDHNEMRATLAEYLDIAIADEAEKKRMLSEGLTEIKKSETAAIIAEIEKITEEEKRAADRAIDIRVNALRGLEGFEEQYLRLRYRQIAAEVERLRQAGAEQIEINAWVIAEKQRAQEEAYGQDIELAGNAGSQMDDIMQAATRSIEYGFGSAMSNIVMSTKTGADAIAEIWKGMASSIISEISRIIAKLAVLSFWQAITGTAPAAAAATIASGSVSGTVMGGGGFNSVSGAGFTSYGAPSSMNDSGISRIASKIDDLVSAIENNPPQIHTQLIEGVPLHKAVERARITTNAL